jgi:predicted transcriptional regulator of viral defense system
VKVTGSATKPTRIYSAPLSAREALLLSSWERERRVLVSTADIRKAVGMAANQVAARMVRKKALERVGRGRYLVRPLRTQGRPTASSAPVIAAALLQGELFYLGGLWALTFHRLTEQQYVASLDVFLSRRQPPRVLGSARLNFHVVEKDQLSLGTTREEIEGVPIQVSTPERTLLDLLDRPALAGGADEALRLTQESLPRVAPALLIELAVRGSRASTCQRLGLLLERAGVPPRKLEPLRRRVRETKSVLSLVASAPRTGTVNPRWRVVENDG